MLFTGVSLKKAYGFFPYESLTKWLFLYKLSFSWLELEHGVFCSFWGLTFLLIPFNRVPAANRMVWNLVAFPRTPSEFHGLENRLSGQQKRWWQSLLVCSSTSRLSPLWCFFRSAPYLQLRERVLLALAKCLCLRGWNEIRSWCLTSAAQRLKAVKCCVSRMEITEARETLAFSYIPLNLSHPLSVAAAEFSFASGVVQSHF